MSDVVNIVFFGFDSNELSAESRTVLQNQAACLKVNPSTDIMIEGHCDERGTRECNLALGARRAEAVKKYLVALGVDSDRIETISYGKERPMLLESNKESWNKNRRAVTILY
jgi:peptidoglycan-associated lipoprotein